MSCEETLSFSSIKGQDLDAGSEMDDGGLFLFFFLSVEEGFLFLKRQLRNWHLSLREGFSSTCTGYLCLME